MDTSDARGNVFSVGEEDFPSSFSEWHKRRRQDLDLTQAQLAKLACCTVFTIRKIESGERRPSKQLAGLLAKHLRIPTEDQTTFIQVARGELNIERLRSPDPVRTPSPSINSTPSRSRMYLPFQPTPLIGREAELHALGKLLADERCQLLTITGLGGIGKTRLAIAVASQYQSLFPDGVYYVSLASLNSPEFIVSAIAEILGLTFSGAADPQEQLLNYLAMRARQAFLLVLDNLEHLLFSSSQQDGKDETAWLLTNLLQRLPTVKILATSRERSNLQGEWIFELQGLPVPPSSQVNQLEDYSALALFLQRARQMKMDFEVLPDERPWLVSICQMVEGAPLAIELAAAWVGMLSLEEIAKEIISNLDFLTSPLRNVLERHRSLRAVFAHSWKLLSAEERQVLCRLAVFQGGFLRQAAEEIAGASLPILMSLLSKSLLMRRENGRYDLHALIRQCALEKLRDSGYLEETLYKHLAYFVSMVLDAHQGLRSALLADWLRRIEQEHDNIRAALEWAFSPTAPSERVEEGLCLIISIDRFWLARGHIREGINWVERGLKAGDIGPLPRAKSLRFAAMLHLAGGDDQTPIAMLQESVTIGRHLNDVICQANALDTLADISWLSGDFVKAKAYYAESLELYRKGGDPQSIGLSLASAGRLYADNGYCQEAESLLAEGLALLQSVSDLRGIAWCFNALGRSALIQGEINVASERFRQSLRLNLDLGYIPEITDGLHELAVVEAIAGDECSATILRAAATALQTRFGFNSSTNSVTYLRAPAAWFQTAPFSEEWKKGEMMSLEEAVAYAMKR